MGCASVRGGLADSLRQAICHPCTHLRADCTPDNRRAKAALCFEPEAPTGIEERSQQAARHGVYHPAVLAGLQHAEEAAGENLAARRLPNVLPGFVVAILAKAAGGESLHLSLDRHPPSSLVLFLPTPRSDYLLCPLQALPTRLGHVLRYRLAEEEASLGLHWELEDDNEVSGKPPMRNALLAQALMHRQEFSREELEAFRIYELSYDSRRRRGDYTATTWRPHGVQQSSKFATCKLKKLPFG